MTGPQKVPIKKIASNKNLGKFWENSGKITVVKWIKSMYLSGMYACILMHEQVKPLFTIAVIDGWHLNYP